MIDNNQQQSLIQAAQHAQQKAYAPYSRYLVGAALLTRSGKIYTGANVENAAYPTSMCAERVAVYKAVSEGEKEFLAIAVVTTNGGMPCGSCRQVLAEFGLQTEVLIASSDGQLIRKTTVAILLPGAFGPEDLNITNSARG
jgi:cytidine deaminase